MSKLFGGKTTTTQSSTSRPFITSTPYSNITGTSLTIDPSIRNLQEGVLGQIPGLQQALSGGSTFQDVLGLRDRLRSNEGGFISAITNPVKEAAAQALGSTERGVGIRGLGGSSFGQQSIANTRLTGARNVADAEALARTQATMLEAGLNEQASQALTREVMAQAELLGIPLSVALQRLQQELASFGLGQSSTGTSTGKTSGLNLGTGLSLFKPGTSIF